MSIIKIGNKEYTPEEIEGLKAIIGTKHDASSTVPTSHPLYGQYQDGTNRYGVFSYPGIRPEMFSTFQRPYTFLDLVGVRPSLYTNEKIGIMTGATDGEGSNAADFCGTPPVGGTFKRCVQNYVWGDWFFGTKVNLLPKQGEYIDYSDMEKRLANLAVSPNPLIPDIMNRIDISNRQGLTLANELWQIGNNLGQTIERVAVRGNSTTAPASTQRGWIREFDGLERQIVTGKVDLDSSVACPGADSVVISWGTGIEASVGGRTFVEMLTDEVYARKDFANRIGMGGTTWAFVGSSRLFRALTYVWACAYYTYRCQASTTNLNYTDATEIRRLQMEMFNGQYLLIDDARIPYVFSDGIRTTRAGGNIWTDDNLFFLPISWNGQSLINVQFKPMDIADITSYANFAGYPEAFPINGGMMLAASQRTRFCLEYSFAARWRLIQDAPFLAFVVNTIQYSYAASYNDPNPASTYHKDGGQSSYDGSFSAT